jgi:hypothetical protein
MGFEIRNRLPDLDTSAVSPPDGGNSRKDLSWNRQVRAMASRSG